MLRRHSLIVRDEARVRLAQPTGQGRRVGGIEPAEAEARQFLGHRVRADGQRAPIGCRLQRRVAEALPERRERDGVAGGVGVGDGAAARRSSRGRRGSGRARPGAPVRSRTRPRPARGASRWRRVPRREQLLPRCSCAPVRASVAAAAGCHRGRRGWSARPRARPEADPGRRRCRSSWPQSRGPPTRRGSVR